MSIILPTDIVERVESEFATLGAQAQVDLTALADSCSDGIRIVRCVLHLASGSNEKLFHYIRAAKSDERDVIWWAEYEGE